jgi:hypothetical protein
VEQQAQKSGIICTHAFVIGTGQFLGKAVKVMSVVALQRVKEHLEHTGFFVEEDYPYLKNGKGAEVARISLAAFVDDQRRDIGSIALVAEYFDPPPGQNPFQDTYTYLAPLWHLAVTPEQIQWWSGENKTHIQATTSIDTLEQDFLRYRVYPDAIRQAKNFQTSFIHLLPELSESARIATRKIVAQRFSDAIHEVRERNGISKLSSAGLDLLTAIILDDKRVEIPHYRETGMAQTPQEAFRRASTSFPHAFHDIPPVAADILDTFWKHLRDGMTYRSMTRDDLSDLLSSLYEGILLSPDRKRVQGSYYTPIALARRVLEHMPIEEIAPDKRIVLDGSCGAGNLLRAASERLEALLPADYTFQSRANYLSQRIIGIDEDPFAVRVARSAQTVTHIPYDLDWDTRNADFLKASFDFQPSIIIANPPFQGQRGRGGEEKAALFLRKYIAMAQDDGLMGIFLPSPLLQNPSASSLRSALLRDCRILELWTLPQNSIPRSGSGIAVLILKKQSFSRTTQQTFRVYTTRTRQDTLAFADAQAVSQSYAQQIHRTTEENQSLVPSILADTWQRLQQNFPSLRSWGYKVYNGIQGQNDQFADSFKEGWFKCLSTREGFEPYHIDWGKQTVQKYVDYSANLKRARTREHFLAEQKIVIQGKRSPNSPWRLIAAIDEAQLIVKETFHYILPVPNAPSLTVLVALLNSSLANAWYSEHVLQMDIIQGMLETFPMPIFSSEHIAHIEHIVQQLMRLKQSLQGHLIDEKALHGIRSLVKELDHIVADAYALSPDERFHINRLTQYGKRPGREWEDTHVAYPHPIQLQPATEVQPTSGEVLAVDISNNRMVAAIPGISRLPLRFPIPPAIPGWALREGVSFSAHIPVAQAYRVMEQSEALFVAADQDTIVDLEQLDLFYVKPSMLAYLDDEQFWEYASRELNG